jgi:surface protein
MYDTPLEENTMTVGNASIELVEYQRGADGTTVEPFENDKLLIPSTIDTDFSGYAVDYKNFNASTTAHVDWNSIKAGYKSPIWDSSNINDEIDKMVFVRNTGNTDVYVRVCFAFEAGNYVWKSHFDRMVHLNKNETDWTWEWYNDGNVVEMNGTRYYVVWATYKHVLPAGEYTRISLSQIALDTSAINDHINAFYGNYEVKAFAQGIQADGFEGIGGLVDGAPDPIKDAPAALNKGFGDELPFRNVKKVEFTDLTTALHWLNAIKNSTRIGGDTNANYMVNTITFGLTKDHADKVKGYDGVMVANLESKVDNEGNVTTPEADFTAYAYYVPTADGKYDIYVLADDWKIYTPNDSGFLFRNMAALTKVDTSNLNVSSTTIMNDMFNGCSALAELDVSDWDVSNVTVMNHMFASCGIKELDVSNWNVEKVTKMQYMFNSSSVTKLDCSSWNVGNVTNMQQMFQKSSVTSLDLSNWDVSNVRSVNNPYESMYLMFGACYNLAFLDVSGWDFGDDNTDKVINMNQMFKECYALKYLDVSSWNVSSVTNMAAMFASCTALKSLDVSNWNVSKVTNMAYMFDGCGQLASLDVSKWEVVGVTGIDHMFSNCLSLKTLDLSGWDVSKVTDMTDMFFNAKALETLDLSGWDVSNVTKMNQMFYVASNLTTIYVSEWDASNVTESVRMFRSCSKLKGGKGTMVSGNPDDITYARIDNPPDAPGYFTDIADKPANP